MLALKNVSITFGENTPLAKIGLKTFSLTVRTGDFVTISGRNGAGKSTLLNLLSGALRPSSGQIFLDQKNITLLTREARATDIAYVFQDPRLGVVETLSIEENLSLAANRGIRRGMKLALHKEKSAEFKNLLAPLKLDLENKLKMPASFLSGGQRQALSLVMAMLRPCKLLLLDEPTAALDRKTADHMLHLIKAFTNNKPLITFMVTHEEFEKTLGNCHIVIKDGVMHDPI